MDHQANMAIPGAQASSTVALWTVVQQFHVAGQENSCLSTVQLIYLVLSENWGLLKNHGKPRIFHQKRFKLSSTFWISLKTRRFSNRLTEQLYNSAVPGWHHSGNQSCATDSGCTCESDELACPERSANDLQRIILIV